MYTVRDLYEYLENCDPDMPVIIQKDGEGNSYSPLSGSTTRRYFAVNTWSGYVTDQPRKDTVEAVVLKPVN